MQFFINCSRSNIAAVFTFVLLYFCIPYTKIVLVVDNESKNIFPFTFRGSSINTHLFGYYFNYFGFALSQEF